LQDNNIKQNAKYMCVKTFNATNEVKLQVNVLVDSGYIVLK